MPRKEIIFVAANLSTGGGVNKVIRDLAELFAQNLGADVRVVNARSDLPSAYAFSSNVRVEQHAHQSLLAYFRLLLELRASRPKAVVGSWTQDNVLIALAFAFSRTKVTLVEHSSWDFHGPIVRALRRFTYRLASQIVVLNPTDLNHYRRHFPRVRLIPNPLTGVRIKAKREKLVLAVGHLLPLKQFDHAIRAFAESGLEQQSWALAIVGSGSARQSLQATIEKLGLKRATIHPPAGDIASWYGRASILLQTSRTESFSLVLAESMLAGVLPIAYAADGPSFILENFPSHLVPIGDAKALAERLTSFAGQSNVEDIRDELSQSIANRFSPTTILEEWKELLH